MNLDTPLVLILNITVIIILVVLILPTLLNKKERLSVRISFSVIFLVVIVNCAANLIIFHFENYELLGALFISMFIPFLFGPAVYFYAKCVNGESLKKVTPHFIIPGIAVVLGIFYSFLPQPEKIEIISQMASGDYWPYNLLNSLALIIPLLYFWRAKVWLKRFHIDENDTFYTVKNINKKWADEFVNYMIFSVFSFALIVIVSTYILHVPQTYMDLIGMPLYFPFLYTIVAVRSNMISKELEFQYALSRSESETKLNEQRISISRDLHDNIGAYANSLIAKIDHLAGREKSPDAEHLKDIKENAETILSLLRQTIWVLNNSEISVESSFDYMKQYAMKTFKNTPIKVRFHEELVIIRTFDATDASHIFRIFQEAAQNIMKHSNATKALISMVSTDKFELTIEDDGDGFEPGKTAMGYGTQNMEERASKMGMSFHIASSPARGTKVTVTKYYV
ncbi:sensor histidine kinase [Kaistella palustris]|uniref:sensor histidine kinase n=1 Tax=Kaistella palustris TaxID=493376 RepID=UPI000416E03C|nr:ATP-binding protein [Kaistella palustris]